jgi:hypothetical protein
MITHDDGRLSSAVMHVDPRDLGTHVTKLICVADATDLVHVPFVLFVPPW